MKTAQLQLIEDDTTSPAARGVVPEPRRRILVVEDEHTMRELNTKMLLDAGYHVDAVRDGEEAWEILQDKHFDLLITDNSMPKITGVELLEKIQAAGMDMPIIMATGVMPKEAFARQPWLRPAAVLIKPYSLPAFLGAVEQALCATEALVGQWSV